jgi:pimeloyl-ACP methyl ester carboxylesterase
MSAVLRYLILFLSLVLLPAAALTAQQAMLDPHASTSLTAPTPQLIVVGFAGGFVHSTNSIHGEVALALHLRDQHNPSIQSEIFENHHGRDAHRQILHLLAAQHIAPANARIILYGHSWGASEAVATARRLQSDGIPVLLLAQVDGVSKRDTDDSLIPANVAQAINFYQDEGLLHGRAAIHAANPRLTRILGNIHLSYKHHDVACTSYPWFARTFMRQHIEIENDPRVWTQIESLILSQVASPSQPQKDIAATTVVSNLSF